MNRNATALILLTLAIGIYFTVTKNIIADISSVKKINEQYVTAMASADKLIKVRDQVTRDYNSIAQEDRDRLDKLIPSTVDNIRLIIDLNSVALRHGFTLRNIKAAAAKESSQTGAAGPVSSPARGPISEPVLDSVNVSFSVSAPYQQFINFMQDIEASLRLMDVTRMTITANDSGIYDYGVEIRTYWLRQ